MNSHVSGQEELTKKTKEPIVSSLIAIGLSITVVTFSFISCLTTI